MTVVTYLEMDIPSFSSFRAEFCWGRVDVAGRFAAGKYVKKGIV
jgi:hypothetical protein